MLEKKMSAIKSDIVRKEKYKDVTCEKLIQEGSQQLEEAKKSWQQAEKDSLKKKDQQMSDKLRKDAAKNVEPKLRQLIERNKEDIERLEREAARELDCHKLELFRLVVWASPCAKLSSLPNTIQIMKTSSRCLILLYLSSQPCCLGYQMKISKKRQTKSVTTKGSACLTMKKNGQQKWNVQDKSTDMKERRK